MDILTAASILGIALTALIAVRSMMLTAQQVSLATTGLLEDQKERAAQREQRRTALLTALKAEVEAIRSTADADVNDHDGYNLSHSRVKRQGAARDVEGPARYRLSFPWTQLPDTAIQEAVRDAGLLGLTEPRIQKLVELRSRILRINSLVLHKANLYPALMLADTPRHTPHIYGDRRWAEDKAVVLNNEMEREVKDILADCAEVMKWWEGGAGVAQSRTSSRPARRAGGRSRAGRWRAVTAAREKISSRLSRLIRRRGA